MGKDKDQNVVLQRLFLVNDKKTGNKRKRYLTEKERKKVIIRYLECGTYQGAADYAGITPRAARFIVDNDPEFVAMYQKKREEEALELFGVLSIKSKKFIKFCDVYFEILSDEAMIRRCAAQDLEKLTRVFAINVDKFVLLNKMRFERSEFDSGDSKLEVIITRKGVQED